MFTCHDTLQRMGQVRYGEDLIDFWVKNKQDQRYTWYLAIATTISKFDYKLDWETLKQYKKNYRESKAYLAYLKNHSNHEVDLADLMERINDS